MKRWYYKVCCLMAVLFALSMAGCSSAVAEKDAAKEMQSSINSKEAGSMINIEVNGKILQARLEDNSSSKALAELLQKDKLQISMQDYGGFEKVGNLPQALPVNDKQTDVTAGDLILYQGNKIVIYYDRNSWNFTRLGRLENITSDELRKLLGRGNVTATFSLAE